MKKIENPEEKRRRAIGMIFAFVIVYLFVKSKELKTT
tara:strand:+ start:167 stop:277 length:111 start_codon:yes stop_codon:yes gene_type:complete